jgi:hypothetical protein
MSNPQFAVAINKDAADYDEAVYEVFGPFEHPAAALAFVEKFDPHPMYHWHITMAIAPADVEEEGSID